MALNLKRGRNGAAPFRICKMLGSAIITSCPGGGIRRKIIFKAETTPNRRY